MQESFAVVLELIYRVCEPLLLTMVDVLEAATAAVLHADPELVTTEVGTVVSDDVGVAAVLHHEDLLLDDAKVVALLQLYHLDGRELAGRDAFRLKKHKNISIYTHYTVLVGYCNVV